METEDPRAALDRKEVALRSAAARDLARMGEWSDLDRLVRMASEDKSSAVRLYTAAAAADIVARYRARGEIDAARRKQILDWGRSLDPGHNPGVPMLLSAVPDAQGIDRLARVLRDPRNGVRAGAAAALRRMALSGTLTDDRVLRDAVAEWLGQDRFPPDARLELARIVGEAGWRGLEDRLRQLAALGKGHLAVAEEARVRLKQRAEPAGWEGFYISDGLDVLEIGAPSREPSWVAIDGGLWRTPGGQQAPLELGERTHVAGEPVRLVFAPRVGEPEVRKAAVQRAGITYWRQEGKDLALVVDEWLLRFVEADEPVLGALSRWLEGEGATVTRAQALVAWRGGDPSRAALLLEELAAGKKPKTDVYYWLGRMYADLGRKKDAIAMLETFLEKAGKRADWRKEAEELRACLA